MARHWAPLRDPEVPLARSRNISQVGLVGDQWGQRPLFSEPGPDQPPPEQGKMGPEARGDLLTATDGRQSADGIASLVVKDARVPVHLSVTNSNVSSPPTDTQIRAILGQRCLGDVFIIRDGVGAAKLWLIVRGGADVWYYGTLTKAV